jgi:hypothetical protein
VNFKSEIREGGRPGETINKGLRRRLQVTMPESGHIETPVKTASDVLVLELIQVRVLIEFGNIKFSSGSV